MKKSLKKIKKKIKNSIKKICKKNRCTLICLRKIRNVKVKIQYLFYKNTTKTNNKLIVFEAFMGRKYACSPKALYEEMIKDDNYNDYTFVWAFVKPAEKRALKNLERAILVKYKSRKFYEYCSAAKYIVTNSRFPEVVSFRKDQIYLQCWHGTPLKRLGYDMTDSCNALHSLKDLQKKYKNDAKRYSYMLSPSKFTTEKLTSAFNLKENNKYVEIIEKGYPRNDFLYNYTEEDLENIKQSLGISNNKKKVILYAPTWRDNQHTSGVGYTYDLGVDFENLQKELSEEFIILFRPHYFVASQFNFDKYEGFVYDVSNYEDITDLFIVTDLLITDYSSVFFDYANLKRPMLFYMYDLDEYREDIRGFYIDFKELPGEIIEKEEKLIKSIKKSIEKFDYDKKYKIFNDKYNYLDDGKVSNRVLERILINEKSKRHKKKSENN